MSQFSWRARGSQMTRLGEVCSWTAVATWSLLAGTCTVAFAKEFLSIVLKSISGSDLFGDSWKNECCKRLRPICRHGPSPLVWELRDVTELFPPVQGHISHCKARPALSLCDPLVAGASSPSQSWDSEFPHLGWEKKPKGGLTPACPKATCPVSCSVRRVCYLPCCWKSVLGC